MLNLSWSRINIVLSLSIIVVGKGHGSRNEYQTNAIDSGQKSSAKEHVAFGRLGHNPSTQIDITYQPQTTDPSSLVDAPFGNNNQTTSEVAPVTTTSPQLPDNVDDVDCSIMNDYGKWVFRYKYGTAAIARLLCRCRNVCAHVTVAPAAKNRYHKERYGVLSERNKTKFTAIVSVYSILLLFGLVGNVTTIVGLLKWVKTSSPTFAFIISLSLSDLLLMCICMPLKVTEYFHLADVFTETTCKLSYYMRDFTMICSVLTLTVISFERYYAICHPLVVQYRCTWIRARNIIIVTWFLSAALAVPTVFMTKYYLPTGLPTMECLQQSTKEIHLHLYFIYYLGILFVLPMLTMTFTYGRSCYGLWKSTVVSKQLQMKDRHHYSKSKLHHKPVPKDVDDTKTRRKVIKILILIVVIFLFCWGPSLIVQLLSVMDIILVSRNNIRIAVESLTYASSAVNPYLFMAMSSQFRVAMLRCLKCRRRRDLGYMNTYKGSTISMHTVSTSGLGMAESDTV